MTRKITSIIILVYVSTFLLWDVFMAANSAVGDTESEITRDFAFQHPMIAVALCTLIPHFFIPRPHSHRAHIIMVVILATLGVVGVVLDFTGILPTPKEVGDWLHIPGYLGLIPYVLTGVGLGFLWPQKPPKETE